MLPAACAEKTQPPAVAGILTQQFFDVPDQLRFSEQWFWQVELAFKPDALRDICVELGNTFCVDLPEHLFLCSWNRVRNIWVDDRTFVAHHYSPLHILFKDNSHSRVK